MTRYLDAKHKSFEAPHGPYSKDADPITKPLEDNNLDQVKVIYHATFTAENDADFYASWQHRNRRCSLGLYYKSTLIGFGIVCEDGRLAFLATAPEHRGSGAGTQLLQGILATLDYCYLVPVASLKVVAWYERHGFRRVDDLTRIYRSDEYKFLMVYDAGRTITNNLSRESSGSEFSVISL
jgi:ribosomal protein S18 acetylase RimI-like enzyme